MFSFEVNNYEQLNTTYQKYKALRSRIADLNNILAVLQWDQEVMMPPKGSDFRAQQISTLSGMAHELSTSTELEDLLNTLAAEDLNPIEKANVKDNLRTLLRDKKLSNEFVMRHTRTCSEAYDAWAVARKENDFSLFENKLKAVVDLSIEKAHLYGFEKHPYDALMDEYEPGLTTDIVEKVFVEAKA
ncbi:MAG: carboxypeptidase M32, partial [Bacteroidetes bacterium]|nr:carboxypeptidase M32 [Bacteroidota bacterium]